MDLFSYPTSPGHRGIPTSVEGAKHIQPKVGTMYDRILEHLDGMGRWGATNCELREIIGCENGTMSARIRELVLKGQIVDSGNIRKAKSGVNQIVWVRI